MSATAKVHVYFQDFFVCPLFHNIDTPIPKGTNLTFTKLKTPKFHLQYLSNMYLIML